MTPEEQDCYDALREDNDCLKQENDDLAARLAQLEKMADVVRLDVQWQELVSEKDRYKVRLAEAVALLRKARMGVKNSAVQFGYPYTEYVDSIDAFLAKIKEGKCLTSPT